MKEATLVIIKPDGVRKRIVGDIFNMLEKANLDIVGIRMVKATRQLIEEHYKHIKGKPFFEDVVYYLLGKFHKQDKLILIILYGPQAIRKCREIAGATNPKEAPPNSIRGAFGRITSQGLFENVVHVSSDALEAEREIKLWFDPDNIAIDLYPTKIKKTLSTKKRVWA